MLETLLFLLGFLVVSFSFVVFFGAPYVPTLSAQINDIKKIYKFKNDDVFVDIGSGDGVVLRAFSKNVKKAIGYELSPYMWVFSKILCRKFKNISLVYGNFWSAKLPAETTVVYTFLSSRHMKKLEKKLQNHVNQHKKPLSLVSYGFKIPGKQVKKTSGPMFLYIFTPLQT